MELLGEVFEIAQTVGKAENVYATSKEDVTQYVVQCWHGCDELVSS